MHEKNIPQEQPLTEQDLWRQFESTGSVQEYLRYRQVHNAAAEEQMDAEYGDGAGAQRGQSR